jgi:hypothetical protein
VWCCLWDTDWILKYYLDELRVQRINPLNPKLVARLLKIISLNSVNQLIFVMVKCGVLFKVRTEFLNIIVTYSGFYIHDGTLLHSKTQYTTVKHSRQLLEHTYTSDPHGLGTLTPIEFFQQDLLWQSSNTHCHSCSQKAFKHTSGQSIIGLSVHLHTTTALRRIVNH